MKLAWTSFFTLAFATALAHASTVKEFIEEDIKPSVEFSKDYLAYKKKSAPIEDSFKVEGGVNRSYKVISQRVYVPGFASSKPLPHIARLIGPSNTQFFLGSKVFLKWVGAPGPREGAIYSIFTPMVLLQNSANTSDFLAQAYGPKEPPKGFHHAGYLYDTNGEIRITKISQGLAEGIITKMRGQINIDDELMLPMPRYESITPINTGIQTYAAIVGGSPFERLIPLLDTFVYLNRGAKNGVKVGQVYEAVDDIPLEGKVANKPQHSLGEAMVVFVADNFSTAVITKQFDSIRIGSILKSKQDGPIARGEHYTLFVSEQVPYTKQPPVSDQPIFTPEKPFIPEKPTAKVEQPAIATQEAPLSELDKLERRERAMSLTAEEKLRLEQLDREETTKKAAVDDTVAPSPESFDANGGVKADPTNEAPSLPPPPSAFVQQKEVAKKDNKKKQTKKDKSKRDEEELNQLMMQD